MCVCAVFVLCSLKWFCVPYWFKYRLYFITLINSIMMIIMSLYIEEFLFTK